VGVSELWSYHSIGGQMRFTLVHRAQGDKEPAHRSAAPPQARAAAPVRKAAPRKPVARPAKRRSRAKPAGKAKKPLRSAKRR
jgi:hypothetical protein